MSKSVVNDLKIIHIYIRNNCIVIQKFRIFFNYLLSNIIEASSVKDTGKNIIFRHAVKFNIVLIHNCQIIFKLLLDLVILSQYINYPDCCGKLIGKEFSVLISNISKIIKDITIKGIAKI